MFDIAAYRRIVESATYHQFIGLKLAEADAARGIAVLHLPYRPDLAIFAEAGAWHGGVISALIDAAGAVTCGLALGRPIPTVNFRVDFLKSPVLVDLIGTGRLVRAGRSVAVADVEVTDAAGELYAVGRGTFSIGSTARAVTGGAATAG